MSEKVGLDIAKCTKLAETCPAVAQANESLVFYETVAGLDPDAPDMRVILGDFVASCAKGTCPGQHFELTRQLLRDRLDLDKPEQ